jgi:hypothetical protein
MLAMKTPNKRRCFVLHSDLYLERNKYVRDDSDVLCLQASEQQDWKQRSTGGLT